MDAELKEYLDDFKAKMAQHFEVFAVRLEERLDARIDALRNEMRDGFISVDERFRTMESRLDRLEARIAQLETRMSQLETRLGDIETRLSAVEREVAQINSRLDTLSDDMRQRFRVLTDRVAALAA